MDTLQMLLLERPLAVYVALAFAEGIMLLLLYVRRTRGAVRAAAVPVILGVLVAVLSTLVTTQRERVAAALEHLRRSGAEGNVAAMAAAIDENYDDGRYRKESVLRIAEAARTTLAIDEVKLLEVAIEVDGPRAVVECRMLLHTRDNPMGRGFVMTRWRLWWARRGEGWRLVSSLLLEPPLVSGAPMGPPRDIQKGS